MNGTRPGTLDRRHFLGGAVATASGLLVPKPARALKLDRPRITPVRIGSFPEGVASGIPGERAVTLWTRVDESTRRASVSSRSPATGLRRGVVHRQGVLAAAVPTSPAKATMRRKAPAGRGVLLPLRHRRTRLAGRPLPDRAPARFARAGADRVLLLPGLPGRLLHAAPRRWRRGGPRPHRLPGRLHLRAHLRRRAAQGHARAERRRRGADARRVPREVPHVPHRPDLQAMHAAPPFIAMWDDHEVEDNWAGDNGRADRERRRVAFEDAPAQRLSTRSSRTCRSAFSAGADRLYRRCRSARRRPLAARPAPVPRRPACDHGRAVPARRDPAARCSARRRRLAEGRARSRARRGRSSANQVMMMALDAAPGRAPNHDSGTATAPSAASCFEFVRDGGSRTSRSSPATSTRSSPATCTRAAARHARGRDGVRRRLDLAPRASRTPSPTSATRTCSASSPTTSGCSTRTSRTRTRTTRATRCSASETALRVDFRAPRSTLVPESPVSTLARFRVPRGRPAILPA